MFRRIDAGGNASEGHFHFEGQPIPFRTGDSVAAALLAAGVGSFRRSAIDDGPRAPYCMMGICFECLVEVDGQQNRQACLTLAEAGMTVCRQGGARRLR